jgi:hypothetical protein
MASRLDMSTMLAIQLTATVAGQHLMGALLVCLMHRPHRDPAGT